MLDNIHYRAENAVKNFYADGGYNPKPLMMLDKAMYLVGSLREIAGKARETLRDARSPVRVDIRIDIKDALKAAKAFEQDLARRFAIPPYFFPPPTPGAYTVGVDKAAPGEDSTAFVTNCATCGKVLEITRVKCDKCTKPGKRVIMEDAGEVKARPIRDEDIKPDFLNFGFPFNFRFSEFVPPGIAIVMGANLPPKPKPCAGCGNPLGRHYGGCPKLK